MKITNLEIDGFGVWSGLRVERMSDSLNVLYGPNEAGKTTLLQFIRSMLYGFSPARRRYLPPLHGGRPGGTIEVAGPHGRFQIARHADDGDAGESLTLTAPDGARQGEHFLKVLLANVEESVFNNVFAVELAEIQELATLTDTEAAELLYNLSAGLDRVSLVEVMRALESSRNRILDAGGGPCQVSTLLAERGKLVLEIEELEAAGRRYAHLAAEREGLQAEIARLEEESARIERLARLADLAASLRERWRERAALDEQLAALGPAKPMPRNAVGRLDAANARLRRHARRLAHLARRRKSLRREWAETAVNESLRRQAVRIEAFAEQAPWIEHSLARIGELEREVAGMEEELSAECGRLGFASDPAALPELSRRRLAPLRAAARQWREARRRADDARQALARAESAGRSLNERIDAALAARGKSDLAAAMEEAGNRVALCRRRAQLDDRLDQLARHQAELEDRRRALADRQVLPAGALVAVGSIFVVGAVMLLAGLFLPASITGSVGWGLCVLGLAGVGLGGGAKVMLERAGARQLDACDKQLELLRLQIRQTTEERESLDGQLPRGGGPLAVRLQAAEAELAALEELTPLDSQRSAARQEAELAARRVAEAEESLQSARRRWREAAAAVGLPDAVAPKHLRGMTERGERIAELHRRLVERREELARRRAETDAFSARLAQLAAEAGVSLVAADLPSRLRELADAAARQAAAVERRDAIRREVRRLRALRSKRAEALAHARRRRRKLFIAAGVKDEREYRRRALESARADVLRRRREELARDIAAAVAPHCSEDAIRRLIEGETSQAQYAPPLPVGEWPGMRAGEAAEMMQSFQRISPHPSPLPAGDGSHGTVSCGAAPHIVGDQPPRGDPLENRAAALRRRLAELQSHLRGLLERRGRLSEQLDALAADRTMASKRLDLTVVEQRLDDARHRWRVLAATCRALDSIRETYERDRQPETLREASGYLDRLTGGRYRRVWTPLGERALRVDDATGHALPVESLSRGTREQLFMSLRLALASFYARHGAPLPLVLDDVLVNFDTQRAKAAAAVLRDFAAEGHQLLVFTCHEHILKLFTALRAPVARLPDNAGDGPAVISLAAVGDEKPRRERRKSPAKTKPSPESEASDDFATEDAEEDSLWEGENDDASDSADDKIAAAWDYGLDD